MNTSGRFIFDAHAHISAPDIPEYVAKPPEILIKDMKENGIFQNVQSKMQEILQAKGMNVEEAQAEAGNTVPDLISGLREKFESNEEGDKEWDFSQLTNLASGLVGGNASDLLNKAKNLL